MLPFVAGKLCLSFLALLLLPAIGGSPEFAAEDEGAAMCLLQKSLRGGLDAGSIEAQEAIPSLAATRKIAEIGALAANIKKPGQSFKVERAIVELKRIDRAAADDMIEKQLKDLKSMPPKGSALVLTTPELLPLLIFVASWLVLVAIGAWPSTSAAPKASAAAEDAAGGASAAGQSEDPRLPGVVSAGLSDLAGPAYPELLAAVSEEADVASLVAAQALAQPRAVALIDGADGASIVYEELMAKVSALAEAMKSAGLRRGDVLAVFLQPSPALCVALLAAVKAGVVWCTLDPETPGPRLQDLIKAAGARLALLSQTQEPIEALPDLPSWSLGQFGEILGSHLPAPRELPADQARPENGTSCIFFTSGSTGVPKGVMWSNQMILHGVLSVTRLCTMGPSSVALLKIPTIWAVLEWEAFPALVAGGSIVCDVACQKNLQRTAEVLSERGISVLMSSAPVLKALCEGSWAQDAGLLQGAASALKHIVNVGGALPLEVAAQTQAVLPRTRIHNVYGCTESCCTEWTYSPLSMRNGNAPAGRPQPEVDVYVVNSNMERLPAGEEGEIYFGSAFNAMGYLGDKSLSEGKFLPSPWREGHRLYKTGDLGRLVPEDGSNRELVLEVRGRVDRQLNISGVRVAPEEIETAIRAVEGVQEAAVVQGGKFIVAFFVGKSEDLEQRIKKHCSDRLYSRMQPELIIKMEEFPRLRNGKVDLKALSAKAEAAVGDSMVQAVDSLGLMKNVNKDVLREMTALSVMRALAISEVFLFHLLWTDFAVKDSSNLVVPAFDTFIPNDPIRWFIRGTLQSQWPMLAFALMSARTDRQALEERKPGWMRENMLVYCMFVFARWPLAVVMQLGNDALQNDVQIEWEHTNHRWYLAYWVICRFLSLGLLQLERPLERLGKGGHLLRCTALVMMVYTLTFIDNHKLSKPPAFVDCDDEYSLCFLTSIFHQGMGSTIVWWLYAIYIAGFWYGKPVAAAVWKMWPKNLGAVFPFFLFVAGTMLLGGLDEWRAPLWVWRQTPAMTYAMPPDLLLFGLLMIAVYMAAEGPWFTRLRLVDAGNVSLGTYIIHLLFLVFALDTQQNGFEFRIGVLGVDVPDVKQTMTMVKPYLGSLGMLLVFLVYPLIFGLTIGALFQKAFLSGFAAAEKGVYRLCGGWQDLMSLAPVQPMQKLPATPPEPSKTPKCCY
eukprot:TRINITY_DN12407_c0_g1_i1.p1 TRINITY_DN12407_c0_g1~~TRINITY_DN12407_c0_g1_i1.p1  ORF type:complete len:1179 (+),score=281.16 TRINITY_DN12407_c0_g1_i1:118-3654(+)